MLCAYMESGKKNNGIDSPQSAIITNIQGFSIHDGPGIRTVVFFKGCPLSCQWCANPECLSGTPRIGFVRSLCTSCGKCLEVCTNNAIRHGEGEHRIDYSLCRSCGNCAKQCYYGSLVRYGESMTLAEVWDAVRRDKLFYNNSGGGVTVSGGEPLSRAEFVRELFELSRQERIDTCVETCGFVDSEALLKVIPVTDHFLFDLKHMNSNVHQEYTGQRNDQILRNAALLVDRGADVVFRQPLIPGVNDSIWNIEATARFLAGLGKNAARLQIMPYHKMGESKYRALHLSNALEGHAAAADDQAEIVRQAYVQFDIDCTISR
jgi:pyruvate formate lyase activating enzyme